MTNEDVIDLYKRVKPGTVVVVLAPHQGDSPFNPRRGVERRPVRLSAIAVNQENGALGRRFCFDGHAHAPSVDAHDFRRHAEPQRHVAACRARPTRSCGGRARRCGHRQSARRMPTAPRAAACSGNAIWPPWVWPASVSATRAGTCGENIRLVHQQDHRIVGGDARQRAGQIVDAAEAAVAEPVGDLVAEPGQPEAAGRLAEQHGVVFQHRNAHLRQARRARRRCRTTSRDCRGSHRRRAARCSRASSAAQTGMRHAFGDEIDGWRNNRRAPRPDRS